MMNFKKILLILLSCLLVCGSLLGCGKKEEPQKEIMNNDSVYPIIKPEFQNEIKFNMMAPCYYTVDPDWENNKFFKRMTELTGVNLNYQVYNYEMYGVKKPLVLSSPTEMPDFFMKALFDRSELVKYGGQGLIIPLEDLIKNHMPNLQKLMDNDPMIKSTITCPDGHIYSLPEVGEKDTYNFVSVPWINKKWLDNLNLEMPTTPEEFYNVMVKFRDEDANGNGDKNDEIPMLISGMFELNSFFSFFGIDAEYFFQISKEGKMEFGPETQRYKDALKWISKLYSEGLLRKDFEGYSINQKWYDGKNGEVGYFVDYASYPVVGDEKSKEYVTLNTVKNEYFGTPGWYGSYDVTDGFFTITKKCKYPEVICRWIDTMYDPEYSIWALYGKENEEWKWDDAEKTTWSFMIPEKDRAKYMSKATIQGGGGMPYLKPSTSFMEKCSEEKMSINQREVDKMQSIGFDGFPKIYLKNSVAIKQASVMYADINKYIEKIKNDIIKGTDVNKAYEDYDTMKKRLNIDGYISLYKEGYKIYQNNLNK